MCRNYWPTSEQGATSFVVSPCGKPRRGVCLPEYKHLMMGTLWLRDNGTGNLTFVRECPICKGKHYPNKKESK
jgi:hypothetical protein